MRGTSVHSSDFVVARAVSAAPSAFVFFDGTEAVGHGRGKAAEPLPGVAFFVDEAWSCADMREAQAQAARLNARAAAHAVLGEEAEPWIAIAVRKVISAMTPQSSANAASRGRGSLSR
ncbi:hypothetical protein [Aquabacter cavernae]|uniref:hypothetical protein n=1 Tax=Aquabacter cavernae TaxID=2496029 RepID=UPI000F8DB217|nr:hypothetical protein [Aquabacter cavernae]